MPKAAIETLTSFLKRAAITTIIVIVIGSTALAWLWRDRPLLSEIGWSPHPSIEEVTGSVTVTWLGVTTLLFDDGETQILIDGFFSRPTILNILLGRAVESDAATINYALNEYRMNRIAAIIPVHSHFDHAMDIGAIANRSSGSIIGSSTTVQIARGAGVPEDQIVLAAAGIEYAFGNFTVTLIDSTHAPIGWGGATPFAGAIEEPLVMPAPITAWREGHSYSIFIAHPHGTTLVQGSPGFLEGALETMQADVVMLAVGQLRGLGRAYAEKYWRALVTATGAKRVFPMHFDDFTKPFGDIVLPPKVLDNFVDTAGWLDAFRTTWDRDTRLYLPVFGQPMVLYPQEPPEA